MRTVTLTGDQRLQPSDLERAGALPREVMDAAQAIVDDVRERGDAAVREYCFKFDGTCPQSFRAAIEQGYVFQMLERPWTLPQTREKFTRMEAHLKDWLREGGYMV